MAPGAAYSIKDHRPGILLVDNDKTDAVFLDYYSLWPTQADPSGNLVSVTLRLPAGTQLPKSFQASVNLDVFAIAQKSLP